MNFFYFIIYPLHFLIEQQTYDNAIIECKKKGMILATAESEAESRCLFHAIAEKGL
jgi:hypothetical protein